MAKGIRVQEYIERSGRYHLFTGTYDDIPSALRSLKMHARICASKMKFDNQNAEVIIQTDGNTTFTVTNGKAKRVFSLVIRRATDSVPFGHLLRKEVTQ